MTTRRHGIWILHGIVAVLAGGILVWLCFNRPNPAAWPRCEYFRCLECRGPASIDPDQPERWGCRVCGYSTLQLVEHFRIPRPGEVSPEDLAAVSGEGGAISDPEQPTLLEIYTRSGPPGYRVDRANAWRGK